MTEELKPCPFCGTQPRIGRMRDESLWSHDIVEKTRVQCDGCDIATDYTEEGQDPEAIEKWNTRAAPPASTGVVRDAERYRWMRDNAQTDTHFDHTISNSFGGDYMEFRVPFVRIGGLSAPSLDSAIDVAIAAAPTHDAAIGAGET